MEEWILITCIAVSVTSVSAISMAFLWRCCCCYKERVNNQIDTTTTRRTTETEISETESTSKYHHHQIDLLNKNNTNLYTFRTGFSIKPPLFDWRDHPSLVTDAVENGWSRFGFTNTSTMNMNKSGKKRNKSKKMYSSSLRSNSTLLRLCSVNEDSVRDSDDIGGGGVGGVETVWEVSQGSVDFMQKIRFNTKNSVFAMIKTALPLPGPTLGNNNNTAAFPEEAYFEITILRNGYDQYENGGEKGVNEGEKAKLIRDPNLNSDAVNSDSVVHVTSNKNNKGDHHHHHHHHGLSFGSSAEFIIHEVKMGRVMLSLGLTTGGRGGGGGGGGGAFPSSELPGSYPGSIGFNSDDSLYLDGNKLVFESEKPGWGKTGQVIGCGYDPTKKNVFFTVDSELLHVIHCRSDEFGSPLYPIIASNSDVTILVNFGQKAFDYAPANAKRTPNPCFMIGHDTDSRASAIEYEEEDSRELFSMGRIDSQWLNRTTTTTRGTNNNGALPREFDEESEADLFEIVIDSIGRSPRTDFY